MVDAAVQLYSFLVAFILLSVQVTSLKALFVDITYVESAVAKGAVCLDGSPPAYHLHRGFGAGINNWVVHMEGGGWCYNLATCLARSQSRLGSSKRMDKDLAFSAILSNESEYNPDFYNWNRVKVRYCDGASFTGDVEEVHPVTNLHFRGARIFVAVMEELLAKGMRKAENALLSGCSAGGLTTILHCDSFRSLLPMGTNVKCMSDAGYFVNVKDISRGTHIEKMFDEVVTLHGSAKNLPLSCTLRMKPSLCFFPQNVVSRIRTPLFILNAAYDSWQIRNVLAPDEADPRGSWSSCKIDVRKCNTYQLQLMHGFRLNFIRAFAPVLSSPARGFFINSCFSHCQSEQQMYWLYRGSPEIAHTSIAKAVGDWVLDRVRTRKIACPFPCRWATCHVAQTKSLLHLLGEAAPNVSKRSFQGESRIGE